MTDRGKGALSGTLGSLLSWTLDRTADAAAQVASAISELSSPAEDGSGTRAEAGLSWAIERWMGVVESLPGASATERALLRALKRRLEHVEGCRRGSSERERFEAREDDAGDPGVFASSPLETRPLSERLQEILERSVDQTREQSRDFYFSMLLERLTPDEARILAALSDGSTFALIHVGWGPVFGELKRRVQDNVSSVGRAAGVMMPDLVPRYLAHLRELELVETGPEDRELGVQYEIVETDSLARDAMKRIEAEGRTPRIVRRSLRISELGRALWEACQPRAGADDEGRGPG